MAGGRSAPARLLLNDMVIIDNPVARGRLQVMRTDIAGCGLRAG